MRLENGHRFALTLDLYTFLVILANLTNFMLTCELSEANLVNYVN